MNATEYAKYERAVQTWLNANEVRPACYGPVDPEASPFYSAQPCECCQRPLAGDRERYTFTGGAYAFEADICTDCVYWLAYGRLDDATMLEVEAEQEGRR